MSEKKNVYAIGQVLTIKEDTELDKGLGRKVTVKKGTKRYVGADRGMPFVHYLNDYIQPMGDGVEVKGYSVTGIAEWIYEWLSRELPFEIDEMLEDYDETKESFMEVIADALEELGMYDARGNRL